MKCRRVEGKQHLHKIVLTAFFESRPREEDVGARCEGAYETLRSQRLKQSADAVEEIVGSLFRQLRIHLTAAVDNDHDHVLLSRFGFAFMSDPRRVASAVA